MGGDYYDRDVATTTSDVGYSTASVSVVGKVKSLQPELNPLRWKDQKLPATVKHPIVFSLDVTGSMGDWTKIIYDKMPMFYGQIMMQNYLQEPAISFCAVGDYTSDEAPLQITEFKQGSEIDSSLAKMYLEGGGGGTHFESYELAAYFYDTNTDLSPAEMPFFFVTGDESFYEKIPEKYLFKILGKSIDKNFVIARDTWKTLMKKYNVFLIKKPYDEERREITILKQWTETIGEERILMINNAKACVDVMLGAIALTSGHRNLEEYVKDMENRGQTVERITEVSAALKKYADKVRNSKDVIIFANTFSNLNVNSDSGNNLNNQMLNEHQNKVSHKENVNIDTILSNETDQDKIKLREDLKHMKELFGTVPEELLCPITGDIFVDPVMTCDGHTYEHLAIESWLIKHKTSPVTNMNLDNKNLIPNFVIRQLVKAFYEENRDKLK
jgi:hypothetical protein